MTEGKTTARYGGTHTAYHVEVRASHGVKTMMGKQYGQEWVTFTPDRTCIPASSLYRMDRQFGLMTYAEAMAVAWMVHAYCESMHEIAAMGMEVRIVQSFVTWSYDAKRVKEFASLPRHPVPMEES